MSDDLAMLLGIDDSDPGVLRAHDLAAADQALLRALVQRRKEIGITQATLAAKFGIAQATIAAFEKYDNDPRLSTVRRYAHGVGVDVLHSVVPDPTFAELDQSAAYISVEEPVRRAQILLDHVRTLVAEARGAVHAAPEESLEQLSLELRQLLKSVLSVPPVRQETYAALVRAAEMSAEEDPNDDTGDDVADGPADDATPPRATAPTPNASSAEVRTILESASVAS